MLSFYLEMFTFAQSETKKTVLALNKSRRVRRSSRVHIYIQVNKEKDLSCLIDEKKKDDEEEKLKGFFMTADAIGLIINNLVLLSSCNIV